MIKGKKSKIYDKNKLILKTESNDSLDKLNINMSENLNSPNINNLLNKSVVDKDLDNKLDNKLTDKLIDETLNLNNYIVTKLDEYNENYEYSIIEIDDENTIKLNIEDYVVNIIIKNNTNIFCDLIIYGNISGLKKIICEKCQLTSFTIIGENLIECIDCNNNLINFLDLTNCKKIKSLLCNNNLLNELIIDSNNLIDLHCQYNNLSNIVIDKCYNLVELYCFNNNISEINLIKLNQIENIDCSYNNISTLNFSSHNKLKQLFCSHNQIPYLDLTNAIYLEFVCCSYSNVKLLNITNCKKIKKLITNGNPDIEIIH